MRRGAELLALRPVPANAEVVPADVDPSQFDVVIVATREQYLTVCDRVAPDRIIFISHTVLHPWDREFFAALPEEVEVVYVSDHKRATFGELGRRGRTIRLAVDTENDFRDYTGVDPAVLSVTNRYAGQQDRGYALFERLTEGLASQVVGHDNEAIPGSFPARDFDHLREVYRTHRCYLNTDPQGRLHLATLEAMGTGMPLVTPPIAELAPYLQHGVNAFVSVDEGELREALEILMADPELATQIGAAGRETVREHFGIDRFVAEWNELLQERAHGGSRRSARTPAAGSPSEPAAIFINAMSVGGEMTGIGHHARNLVRALGTTDAEQRYLLLTSSSDLTPDDDPRFRQVVPEPVGDDWEQFTLPELLAERAADVYHNPAFGLPVVKSCGYVCTVHDCIPRLFPEYAPAWLRDFFEHWAPTWMRLADHIICVSEHTRRDIIHLYGVHPARTSVVHQCADDIYRPVLDTLILQDTWARCGIDRPYILCVGRVELRKNVAGMMQAFEVLRHRWGDELLLVFAGPRDDDAHDPGGVLPPPGRHGNILVTGYLSSEDLAALYSGCEVFCFPSFYEGFGIPVLEAMQCGAPVVTSRVSSLPEVGGDAPLYASPYDAEEIAHRISAVLSDRQLRQDMSARGIERARHFSLERFGRETASVYESVASA